MERRMGRISLKFLVGMWRASQKNLRVPEGSGGFAMALDMGITTMRSMFLEEICLSC